MDVGGMVGSGRFYMWDERGTSGGVTGGWTGVIIDGDVVLVGIIGRRGVVESGVAVYVVFVGGGCIWIVEFVTLFPETFEHPVMLLQLYSWCDSDAAL